MEASVKPGRRGFLLAGMGLLAHAALARAAVALPENEDGRSRLGSAWRVPAGTRVNIPVPAGDPAMTLAQVMTQLLAWEIPFGTSVTIRLADGEHPQPNTVPIRHADGRRIRILGNTQNPAACRLSWPAHTDGFLAEDSCVLGLVDGVTLMRAVPGGNNNGATDNACGMVAANGGIILCGYRVVVDGFYYGFQARHGGILRCDGTRVLRAGDAGYFAYAGGHLSAQRAEASFCSDSRIQLGSGFVAEYGGTIDATGSRARNNALAGFAALSTGSIIANQSVAENNGRNGYRAITNGVIVAHDATARNHPEPIAMAEGGRVSGQRLAVEKAAS